MSTTSTKAPKKEPKSRKKKVVEEKPVVTYHYEYCSGCGSRKMIKNRCQICGYVRKGPLAS